MFGVANMALSQPRRVRQNQALSRQKLPLLGESVFTLANPEVELVSATLETALNKFSFVEDVYATVVDGVVQVVALCDTASRKERNQVWNLELSCMEQYPKIEFDILLLQRRSRERPQPS